ncbi:MAG: hypothetical protein IPH18_16505 [Chitinophagaceae bacterium]|nr:hypothetical protein [Chitinophagaceae bacterium]
MKKILLTLTVGFSGLFSLAQPAMNELYITPGSTVCDGVTRKEFFEIYNGNQGGGNAVGTLGCYYMIVNWINGAGGPNNQGFYVIDFPTGASITDGYYTASSDISFGTQTGNGNPCSFIADISWNSGIMKKYTAISLDANGNVTAYDGGVMANSVTNLFDENDSSGGH